MSFRFPHGYRGDLATVYYLEGTSGRFTATGIGVRKNALVDGRVYDQRIDGTLYQGPMSAINFGPPL